MRAKILDFVSSRDQELFDLFFVAKASVIGSDGDFRFWSVHFLYPFLDPSIMKSWGIATHLVAFFLLASWSTGAVLPFFSAPSFPFSL